jgi:hypothetical protein
MYSGKFPNDFFSVQWSGYLTAPMTGTYTITLTADYGVRLWVNGVQGIDQVPMTAESVSYSVELVAGQNNDIVISYFHQTDEANFVATWTGPGVPAGTVLDGNYLSYARHIINSPVTVEVYPGDVDASTSSASGDGLATCTALDTCEFVVQARDTAGNNIFNEGSVDWNVTIRGFDDWAGYDNFFHRINDVNYTEVVHENVTITPYGWQLRNAHEVAYQGRSPRHLLQGEFRSCRPCPCFSRPPARWILP